MRNSSVAAGLCVATLAMNALAGPKEGTELTSSKVVDTEGRALELRTLRGKPLLMVYENKEASNQNVTLKSELSKLAKGEKYRTSIALVAIADVEGYDYWPARGFVKKAIRSESKKLGNTIYIDWDGSTRRGYGFTAGKSAVVLTDAAGKVLFSREGALDATARSTLIALLRAQVEDPAS